MTSTAFLPLCAMLRISAFLPTTRTGVRGYGHRVPRERKYVLSRDPKDPL